jgi:hypothetical protein
MATEPALPTSSDGTNQLTQNANSNLGPFVDFDDDPGFFTFSFAQAAFNAAIALFETLAEDFFVPNVPLIRDFPLPEFTSPPVLIPDLSDAPELEPILAISDLPIPVYNGGVFVEPTPPTPPPPLGDVTIEDIALPIFAGTDFETPEFFGVEPVVPAYPGTPNAPALADIVPAPLDAVPELIDIPVDIIFPIAPGDFNAIAPADPLLLEPTIPEPPPDDLPLAPVLADIQLPEAPEVFIPTLNAALGPAPIADDIPTFQFEEEDYGSELLTNLNDKLNFFLDDNTTGLAEVIWQQIWERGREREDLIAVKSREEVSSLFASRGFALPPGAQVKREDEIIQENQDASNSLSRDQAIQEAEMEVENVRFAVTQGITLEIALMGNHNDQQQRALEVSRLTVELVVRVFEAQVAAYNAEVAGFQALILAFRAEIEAELAKVEVFRIEVDAQRLIVELNAAQIANFRAQIDAVVATYDLYRAQLEAARFTLDQNRLLIEEFQALTQAYATDAQVLATEADIYETRTNAERIKIDLRNSNVASYAAQVTAFDSLSQARSRIKEQEISVERFKIENFQAQIESVRIAIAALDSELNAGVSVFDSNVRRFSSEVDGEARRVSAEVDKFNGDVTAFRAAVDAEIEQGRISVEVGNQRVAAFAAEVTLHTSRVGARVSEIQTDVARLEAETSIFSAATGRDVGLSQAQATRATASASIFGAEVQGFSAQVQADASRFQADVGKYTADVNAFAAVSQHDVERARVVTEELVGKLGVISERIIAGARISGQLASSALSTHSWSAVRSVSDSWSQSYSVSESSSFSGQNIASSIFSCEC